MGKRYRDLIRAHSQARGSARAVLNILADYATDDGRVWIARRTIASNTGLSERTVTRALQTLCDDERLTLDENERGGRGRVPVYKIQLPECLKGDNMTPINAAERVTNGHVKGDNVTVKGDKFASIYSHARSEPYEPEEEPRQAPPTKIPHVVTNPLNGRAAIDFGRGLPQRHQAKRKADMLAHDREKLGLSAREFTTLTDKVLEGMNARAIAELDSDYGDRELGEAQQCALALASMGHTTPAAIDTLFADWGNRDWRGKKGEKPGYRTLVDYAKGMRGSQIPSRQSAMVIERIEGDG